MIVDHISNLKRYSSINPLINDVIEFISKEDLLKLPLGRTDINQHAYVIRESYNPKPVNECYFEGHEKYADIQVVLSGVEAIGYRFKESSKDIEITQNYLEEKDVTKYQIKNFTSVILSEGMFALVYPQDLHMPKIKIVEGSHVEKVVFKIKVK